MKGKVIPIAQGQRTPPARPARTGQGRIVPLHRTVQEDEKRPSDPPVMDLMYFSTEEN